MFLDTEGPSHQQRVEVCVGREISIALPEADVGHATKRRNCAGAECLELHRSQKDDAKSGGGQHNGYQSRQDAARAAGADVIAITSSKSPLAKKATIRLAVDHSEDSTTFLSMISRILQLLLIDIISVGISLGAQGGESEGETENKRLLISHTDV